LVSTASSLSDKANVFNTPVVAQGSFWISNGKLGIVVDVGDPKNGTYCGEVLVLFEDGRTGWVAKVHLEILQQL
jgi:hypothetical protein